jgi:hypothetical protein
MLWIVYREVGFGAKLEDARCDVANEAVYTRVTESKKEERGLSGNKSAGFKPSTPAGYVRPKPVAVPAKTK